MGDRGRDHRPGSAGWPGLDALDEQGIGAEWIGLARRAWQHFAKSTVVSPLMKSIALYARAAYSTNKGIIPPRVIQQVHRRWLGLDSIGCVLQTIELTGTRSLAIRDVRVTSSTLSKPGWDGSEVGVCIVDNHLTLRRNKLTGDAPVTASLSMHAMARWYQRQASGQTAGLDTLRLELATLAEAAPAILAAKPSGSSIAVETASGAWHGLITTDGDDVWCDIRTFC